MVWVLEWRWGDYEDVSNETVGVFNSAEEAKAAIPVPILRWAHSRYELYDPRKDWSDFEANYIVGLDEKGGEWYISAFTVGEAVFSYQYLYKD